jgi:hypothetical protein
MLEEVLNEPGFSRHLVPGEYHRIGVEISYQGKIPLL